METKVFNTCHSVTRIDKTLKYKGVTYHDGVKVTDWILYKKGNEMNEVLSREVTGTPAAQEATSVDNAGNVQADANTPVKVEVKHVQDEEAVGGKAVESVVL